MASESSLSQNDILNSARKARKRVQIYLVNGIRVVGHVESFDQYVVMLRMPTGMQIIYKKAISTVQHDTSAGRPGRSPTSARNAAGHKPGRSARFTSERNTGPTPEHNTGPAPGRDTGSAPGRNAGPTRDGSSLRTSTPPRAMSSAETDARPVVVTRKRRVTIPDNDTQ
jgi:host factor-I protein